MQLVATILDSAVQKNVFILDKSFNARPINRNTGVKKLEGVDSSRE